MPIPGGYVVPERGNVTFTCSSTSGGLLWTVDLKVRKRDYTDSAGLNFPQVSSMDVPLTNPASFTIHNVTSENNQSFVECANRRSEMSNATVIVEGKGLLKSYGTTYTPLALCKFVVVHDGGSFIYEDIFCNSLIA